MIKPFNPKVFQLGYVGLGVTDLGRSRDHYATTMGLVETDTDQRDAAYLSVGSDHHNLILRKMEENPSCIWATS